jgi:ribonuclease E
MNNSKTMLLNAIDKQETRVAIVESDKLINFEIELGNKEQRKGNIYKAVITRVEPSLEACFLDYGTEKHGFLSFKDIDFSQFLDKAITEVAHIIPGSEIIVQLEKEERGNKGAAFTSFITLAGRYLVLMPNNPKAGGISRRIEFEEREELKALMQKLTVPESMGVILRTAALGRNNKDIEWDLNYLLKLWDAIITAAQNPMLNKKTALLYQESSLVIRSIRDHFSPDIMEILIDDPEIYRQVYQFVQDIMPNFASRIKLYQSDIPLFSFYQIEHKIQFAYARTVSLPSGGVIVIDHTEALTAIDVNSAKSNKGTDIEATAFTTNLEAAEEIARQIRLRDLGGLIVIDFIDMENTEHQKELENKLKNFLEMDRARVKIGKISRQFGLLTISRQRLHNSLVESSNVVCPQCCGVGTIRSVESSVVHILRLLQEDIVRNNKMFDTVHLQLPVDMSTYAINEKRRDIFELEEKLGIQIIVVPNVHLKSPDYKMRVLKTSKDRNNVELSYKLVEGPIDEIPEFATQDNKNKPIALVNFARISGDSEAVAKSGGVISSVTSLLKKIVVSISKIFASSPKKPNNHKKPYKNYKNNSRNNGNKYRRPPQHRKRKDHVINNNAKTGEHIKDNVNKGDNVSSQNSHDSSSAPKD